MVLFSRISGEEAEELRCLLSDDELFDFDGSGFPPIDGSDRKGYVRVWDSASIPCTPAELRLANELERGRYFHDEPKGNGKAPPLKHY
ncbi:MAG: hypothetical protein ABIH37_03740 [archaeon]